MILARIVSQAQCAGDLPLTNKTAHGGARQHVARWCASIIQLAGRLLIDALRPGKRDHAAPCRKPVGCFYHHDAEINWAGWRCNHWRGRQPHNILSR